MRTNRVYYYSVYPVGFKQTTGEFSYSTDERDSDILEAPMRTLPPLVDTRKLRYGTIGYGLDLPRLAWSSEQLVFSCQDQDLSKILPHRPKAIETKPFHRLPKKFLSRNPVDVLLVDEGNGQARQKVQEGIAMTPPSSRPKALVFSGPSNWMLTNRHLGWRKKRRKALEKLGYQVQEWFLEAQQQGGALEQERLIEVYTRFQHTRDRPETPRPQGLPSRPMRNLLMPCGIPHRERAHPKAPFLPATPISAPDQACIITGYIHERPVYDPEGCMPDALGSWVATDRGIRRLQADELAKAKGLPSEWRNKKLSIPPECTRPATALHIWTEICDSLSTWLKKPHTSSHPEEESTSPPSDPHSAIDPEAKSPPRSNSPTGLEEAEKEWQYELPDLTMGSPWYIERVQNLQRAIVGRPDYDELLADGLDALEVHRTNYTEEGPKFLQVLWWEFPALHQEAVRIGSSMRFLIDPGEELVPNPPLTPEQVLVVEEFINELMDLGVVRKATRPLRRVCPIFVVEKPGQPGQWRCIADMRRGGQNDCCGLDPIYLPTSRDILPHLYSQGWSGVADASKYFHNYPTMDNERDLIGIIHPTTGEHLWYVGLPMGSVNSPSISCRIGEGILDMLRQESSVFRVHHREENTWRTALQHGSYRSKLNHGYVSFQANGLPIAQVYAFVDDFFIHAATWEDGCEAMTCFMNLMVRLGLICQKVKTSPPSQRQKYCGFIYDTRKTPTLIIPPNKISRCLASADFLLARPRNKLLSRLSLAIITGVLQSIVEATPQRIGQGHLRSLYDDLHRMEEETEELAHPVEKFYSAVELTPASLEALRWWQTYLVSNPGATTSRRTTQNGIIMKWGDGSGTGTGGTTECYPVEPEQTPEPNIELWMGVWRVQAKPNSSNWKEARTILAALQQERGSNRVKGTTVFYMTDNLVSYYILNGGSSKIATLHKLVMEIKEMELELDCRLEVVHVPGTLMIEQGADAQSRGLWLAPERRPRGINQLLFNAVPFQDQFGAWLMSLVGQANQPYTHESYLHRTSMLDVLGRWTIWTPVPEGARQVIVAYLQSWVQASTTTGGIFVVPRILQKQWGRICRYVKEQGVFQAHMLPPSCAFPSHLPFVVLCVFPHVHTLRRPRMDRRALPSGKGRAWHLAQAKAVRGLS